MRLGRNPQYPNAICISIEAEKVPLKDCEESDGEESDDEDELTQLKKMLYYPCHHHRVMK